MPYSTTAVFVTQGDTLQFKHVAPATYDKTDVVDIKIGKTGVTWLLKTITEDQSPDPFSFIDISNVELSTTYTYADGARTSEQEVTVSGLSAGTQVGVTLTVNVANATVADYALEINGNGNWFLPGTSTRVKNGDKVKIRIKSSASNGVSISATLSLGNRAAKWSVTTKLRLRNIPNPFPSFGNKTGQPLNTYIYSNVVQILGLSSSPVNTQVFGSDSFVGISSSNATTTDANGFEVLSGATFASNTASITNGQYMQLKARSGTTLANTKTFGFSVGEGSTSNGDGSEWQISTTTQTLANPTTFSFVNKIDQAMNSLIESAPAPAALIPNPAGISGLGAGISVPVILVSTTSTEVKIKINDGSIGIFPASVRNGDTITLYAKSSSSASTEVEVVIKVGGAIITPWKVGTKAGADTIPDPLIAPPNLTNVVPDTYQTSGAVFITGIDSPVDIGATAGTLISIDYDTAVAGPREFIPGTNTSFRVILKSSTSLNTETSTNVTVGTNGVFTWKVTTYASVPIGRIYRSAWYSKKNERRYSNDASAKYDGYSIGTIIPVLKESKITNYGTLTGDKDSRFPGFVYCDGRELNVKDYLELFLTIGNTYGGSGNYILGTPTVPATASGTFKLPNYRNRRMCGTGVVDGNNSSSVFLTVSGGIGGPGTYNTVGQEGGYWYVDKVGPPGTLPYEQADGAQGATSSAVSAFFTLGTVKTTGANLVTTDDVEFEVRNGSVTATVGPISPVKVTTPEHEHYYISAVTESDGDEAFVAWGQDGMFGAISPNKVPVGLGTSYGTPFGTQEEFEKIPSSSSFSVYLQKFLLYLSNRGWTAGSVPSTFLGKQTGPTTSLSSLIRAGSGGGPQFGTYLSVFENFWQTTITQLPADPPAEKSMTVIGGPNNVAGVIDTESDSFTVDGFRTTDGTSTATHSHYLSPFRITNPNSDFSYDDYTGAGGQGALRNGLPGGAPNGSEPTLQITFNHTDIQMSFNEGTFTLNTTTKIPKPSYRIEPQSTVPVITQFHKVRYMIKAF